MVKIRILELIALTALWLLLVFKLDAANIVAALIAAIIALAGIHVGSHYLYAHFKLPDGWTRPIATLPWKIIKDSWLIFAALARGRTTGEMVTIPFDYGSNSPDDVARLAITISSISITPNTVAIATSRDGILVHKLAPSPEERRDPKWPV